MEQQPDGSEFGRSRKPRKEAGANERGDDAVSSRVSARIPRSNAFGLPMIAHDVA
jgi:hypothetical protein